MREMMPPGTRRRPRLLLVLTLVALLLGAQQAALIHLIGHLGEAMHAGMVPDADQETDVDHGGPSGLPHRCNTCLAFAAVAATAPPLALAPMAAESAKTSRLASIAYGYKPAPAAPPYTSRAPPFLR
ncbi:MAG TPA: hypothetical protein VMB75_04290 [Rhodocyclaceae bacterium]|nr:hypothetical protein [Rhodocyclaceae bacterium]